MQRYVIGRSVKNKNMPVKKMGMVPCFFIVMLRSAKSDVARMSQRADSQPRTMEVDGGKKVHRGCEGASSQLKQ